MICDNFLEKPEDIIDLSKKITYRPRNNQEYFEGLRSHPIHLIDENLHKYISNKIITTYYGEGTFKYNASIFLHKTQESDLEDKQWLEDKIHTDSGLLAGIIFLTENAPINCGTQTYRKEKNSYHIDVVMGNVYNRLILYPANYYHSASNFFGAGSRTRLTLLFFLNNISNV